MCQQVCATAAGRLPLGGQPAGMERHSNLCGLHSLRRKGNLETCRYTPLEPPTAYASPGVWVSSGPTWLGNTARLQHSERPEDAVFVLCGAAQYVCVPFSCPRRQPRGSDTRDCSIASSAWHVPASLSPRLYCPHPLARQAWPLRTFPNGAAPYRFL